jgi:hypothetical protein
MKDAEKLRTLATWFDKYDDERDFPGVREVQADLRRIAHMLDDPAPGYVCPGCGRPYTKG